MVAPLAIFAAALVGREFLGREVSRRSRHSKTAAFERGLAALAPQPSAPTSAGRLSLQPQQSEFALEMFRVSPQAGINAVQSALTRNQAAAQTRIANASTAESARAARETHQLALARFEETKAQNIRQSDPNTQRSVALARQGMVEIIDPISNNVTVTPMAGTDPFRERTDIALSLADGADLFNQLQQSVSTFGVARDAANPAFGRQQSLRGLFAGWVKEALALGALDEGVLNLVNQLTGDSLGALDFFVGNDAQVLARLNTTGQLVDNRMAAAASDIRLLRPGMLPSETIRFDRVLDDSQRIRAESEQRIRELMRTGGDVQDLPDFSRGDTGNIPGRAFRAQSPMERTRAFGAVMGNSMDVLLTGLIAGTIGRVLPR